MDDRDAAYDYLGEVADMPEAKRFRLPKNLPQSKNFIDRTGRSEMQQRLSYYLSMLNPVTAYHKLRTPQQLADLRKVPPSKNFVDKTGVTSEMRARLDNYFRNLLFDKENKASFIDPTEHEFRHKYKAPPLTREEMIDILHGPYSLGPGNQLNNEPAMDSPYRKVMDDHLRKKWKKSGDGIEVTTGKK